MSMGVARASSLLALSSLANAQFGPPNGYNPYNGGGGGSGGANGGNPYSGSGSNRFSSGGFFGGYNSTVITSHAVLATLAFGFLFPVGGIIIRLLSFPGLWLVHGISQIIAYILFSAALGLGIYMWQRIPDGIPGDVGTWSDAHPIIGIVLFAVLFFQPILGFIHHYAFKKYSRRTVWSYAHLWIGRVVITLGIINGGLGLGLSKKLGRYAPSRSEIIGYSVAAAIMWLLYVVSAIYGEIKRRRQIKASKNKPPHDKNERRGSNDTVQRNVQYA